jgi:transcriptional regulator with XRE-family HTH domain
MKQRNTLRNIGRAPSNRPSGVRLNTAKIQELKARRALSDEEIARRIGRRVHIVNLTINNKAAGIGTQRAIARVLGVSLRAISLATAAVGAAPDTPLAASA